MESEVPREWTGVGPRPLQFEAAELIGLQLGSVPSAEEKEESGSSFESEEPAELAPRSEVAAAANGLVKGDCDQSLTPARLGLGSAPRPEVAVAEERCVQSRRPARSGLGPAPRSEAAVTSVELQPGGGVLPPRPQIQPAFVGQADDLQIAVAALASCAWVASGYRAEFRVHVCFAGSLVPLCKQKKGGEARALRRPAAQGTDWGELTCLPAPYAFCEACAQKLGLTSALARAAVHEIASATL